MKDYTTVPVFLIIGRIYSMKWDIHPDLVAIDGQLFVRFGGDSTGRLAALRGRKYLQNKEIDIDVFEISGRAAKKCLPMLGLFLMTPRIGAVYFLRY